MSSLPIRSKKPLTKRSLTKKTLTKKSLRKRYPTVALLAAMAFLFSFSFFPPAPAAADGATPEIRLQGDFTDAGLRIGSHLEVAVRKGKPSVTYFVRLVDERHRTVASRPLTTSAYGSTGRHRLWTRTGVEGCDAGSVHDPARYRFKSFSEAEAILDGRTFRVVLLESETAPISAAVAGHDLPMVAVAARIRAYPSDSAGCLRTQLYREPLYLAVRHEAAGPRIFQVFVVAEQVSWKAGDPLVDVRPGGPQMITVPAGADPVVELLWDSPVWNGKYQIILRDGAFPSLPPALDAAADFVVETPVSHSGTTYRECHPLCPPP